MANEATVVDEGEADRGRPIVDEGTPPAHGRVDAGASGVSAREQHLIDEATHDMCHAFPWLPAQRVAVVVECLWAEYDKAAIRDFIPVLVRMQAREELRDHFHTE